MRVLILALLLQVPGTGATAKPWEPDFKVPVRQIKEPPFSDDPAILCVHRPLTVPYDKMAMDGAARRIRQIGFFTQVKEGRDPELLGIPRMQPRISAKGRIEGPAARRMRRAQDQAISATWNEFEARLYEIRMFLHQPEEAKLAATRAVEAWGSLKGLILGHPDALTPSMARDLAKIDVEVMILAEQAAK